MYLSFAHAGRFARVMSLLAFVRVCVTEPLRPNCVQLSAVRPQVRHRTRVRTEFLRPAMSFAH